MRPVITNRVAPQLRPAAVAKSRCPFEGALRELVDVVNNELDPWARPF